MALSATACFFGIAGIAIAITIVTILIINKRQKKLTYKPNNSVRCNGADYRYDPVTKTIVESSAPVSNVSKSNLKEQPPSPRKSVTQSSGKSVTKSSGKSVTQSSEKSTDQENTSNVSIGVQTDFNQNNLDNPMSIEEKVNEYFRRNIPVSNDQTSEPGNVETLSSPESSEWSNISSAKSTDSSKKAYKKKVHKSFKKYVDNFIQADCASHSAENSEENSDTLSESDSSTSVSSGWSKISSEASNDDFERKYKKKIHKTLRKFVKNMNKTETSESAPSENSDETSSVLSGELEVCMGCEKNLVNTRTQPCNHRYMCSDCAMKFYRLYKKCKICRAKIEQYVVED